MFTFSFAVKTATVAGMGSTHSYTTKIVPIDVPVNCVKYAEKSLIDGCVKAGLGKPQILPNTALFVGKNLDKIERKEPGARLRAISNAYYKTFA